MAIGRFALVGVLAVASAHAQDRVLPAFSSLGEAYAASAVNSVSLARNVLFSAHGFQFSVFYGPPHEGRVPVMLARRHGDDAWIVVRTSLSVPDAFSTTGARDDHNIVAAALDASGYVHVAWGMHNAPLAYAVSREPQRDADFPKNGTLDFVPGRMIGTEEDRVTYPEFMQAPDGRLYFAYRNGGAGGGSGNGNEYLNAFDARRKTWLRISNPMVDGISTSMNAYLNAFCFDAANTITASWTIRETPDWRTNHDIFVARSVDAGQTWASLDGAALGAVINRAKSELAKVVAVPQQSGLINQTDMTCDAQGAPLITSWWSPRAAEGDATRQYMLVWNEGAQWRQSAISSRAEGEAVDTDGTHVREMGRPLVLLDKSGRTLIVTRSADAAMPVGDRSNTLRVYWSLDRVHWSQIEFDTLPLGQWEPTYDRALWKSDNRLALFIQPVGSGLERSQASVLTWDEAAYFAGQNKH